ncbi:MAG: hypothetical protein HFJ29_01000 [Clostridia bacterium]|nr:hypothetical protein [Clostridia bacterium]
MKIYVVYEKFCADWKNGEDAKVFIESAYRNKRKAVKKANTLLKKSKQYDFRMDKTLKKKKNPFKNNNCVDLYKDEQEEKVKSIVIEEIKLIA